MRKVINGRTYNTDTSKIIGQWDNGHYGNDFKSCRERLYKNTKGAYFLHGEGGPMSKYAAPHGNSVGWGEDIIPMTAEEAREWAEQHLDADEYEDEFGEAPEAEGDLVTRERVNLTVDAGMYAAFRKMSEASGVPMGRMVDRAIIQVFGSQLREYGWKPIEE